MLPSSGLSGDLFEETPGRTALAPGAVVLGGFAGPIDRALLDAVADIAGRARFRQMETRGGGRMSVAITNCGALGWVTDRSGYRYDGCDPESGRAWPAMPGRFSDLAARAAAACGFAGFEPDACLINRYVPGSRMSLHQDRDEAAFHAPIVSVSLGLAATFLWGGLARAERPRRMRLGHGDVVVWGGPARLNFHGIDTLRDGDHPLAGKVRYNLTFRRAAGESHLNPDLPG